MVCLPPDLEDERVHPLSKETEVDSSMSREPIRSAVWSSMMSNSETICRTRASGRSGRRRGRLDLYATEVIDDALLTAEEEVRLALAAKAGDREARNRLITANLRLVIKIASSYVNHGLSLEDLVGEGNLGLLRATEAFDPSFGVRFSTYAVYWIKQSIRHALTTTTGMIRIPSYAADLVSKWRKVERRLAATRGDRPTPEQVAAVLGLSPSQQQMVEQAMRARGLAYFDQAEADIQANLEPADHRLAAPEAPIDAREAKEVIRSRLDRLDNRERAIVVLRFGLGGDPRVTLREAGERLGITREWARVLQQRALQKLGDDPDAARVPTRRRRARRSPDGAAQRRRRSPTAIVPVEGAAAARVSAPPSTALAVAKANR